jgi:hypothetical protein
LLWVNTGGFAIAVDSTGTPTGEEITVPDGAWLRSSIDGTHIFWDPNRGTSLLARPGEAVVDLPRMFLEHSFGSTALLSQVGGRRLYQLDLHSGSADEIRVSGTGAWDNLLSVQSPDRTMVALTLELDPPPERHPETSIDEWIALCRSLPPRSPGRTLYILDLQTGTTRSASTVLPTAFAPQLAWTAHNAHIALKTHDTKTSLTRAVYGWMEVGTLDLGLSPTTSQSASPYVDISNWYLD